MIFLVFRLRRGFQGFLRLQASRGMDNVKKYVRIADKKLNKTGN
jgi:hypothetical protein